MMLKLVMATTVQAAGLYGSPVYQAYRTCIAQTVRQAMREEATPEELPVILRSICREQRDKLADEIARRGHRSSTDVGRDANARETEARTAELIQDYLRRYAMFYTTGMWPKR